MKNRSPSPVPVSAKASQAAAPAVSTAAPIGAAGAPAAPTTGEFLADATRRNDIHSCPLGALLTGISYGAHDVFKTLLCLPGQSVRQGKYETGVEAETLHNYSFSDNEINLCPQGKAVTGLEYDESSQHPVSAFSCAPVLNLNGDAIIDAATARQGLWACPPGSALVGLRVWQPTEQKGGATYLGAPQRELSCRHLGPPVPVPTVAQLPDLKPGMEALGKFRDGKIDQNIIDCYNSNGGQSDLGVPSDLGSGVAVHRWADGVVQEFDGGSQGKTICMHEDGAYDAYLVRGSIRQVYFAQGQTPGPLSWLGYPIANEQTEEDSFDNPQPEQWFEGGKIGMGNVGPAMVRRVLVPMRYDSQSKKEKEQAMRAREWKENRSLYKDK
ncbi:MAG: hypothetical protein HY077_16685 [Elusimicrobia bacterium]|nr:hypothetical protein [Elusimicrobiota bacterium]